MPRAAAVAIVVHTAISAELQAPFPYSEVSAAHTLSHAKTWLAQDKYTFCQVLPSDKPNLYKQKPYNREEKNNSAKK